MTISVRPVNRSPRYQRLLVDLQDGQKTVLLDGPISTELDSRGVTMASGKERRVAMDDPESLVQVHVDYIKAGARIITTNTFGRTRQVLGSDFEELTRAAVDCAFEARRMTGTEDSVVVAGSLDVECPTGCVLTVSARNDCPCDIHRRGCTTYSTTTHGCRRMVRGAYSSLGAAHESV